MFGSLRAFGRCITFGHLSVSRAKLKQPASYSYSAIKLHLGNNRASSTTSQENSETSETPSKRTTLEEAIVSCDADQIRKAAEDYKWLMNHQNNDGATPYHVAVTHGNLTGFQILTALKANPNLQDKMGGTVMHTVVQSKRINEVEMSSWISALVAGNKIDPTVKNQEGNTALDIAEMAGLSTIVEKLHMYNEEWHERQKNERRLKFYRSMVVGTAWGSASLGSLFFLPTTIESSTYISLAAAISGVSFVAGSALHALVTEKFSDRKGTISFFEGGVHGLLVALSVHFMVPTLVWVVPEVISSGLTYESPVQQSVADIYNYGGAMVWFGIYGLGYYTLPGAIIGGVVVSQINAGLFGAMNLDQGLWSSERMDITTKIN
eukprot:m.36082 g.36082  ORF g.36082 m.36082 type:complete len:378 (-) comp9017_c0_seq2:45-1178(-)